MDGYPVGLQGAAVLLKDIELALETNKEEKQ